VVVTYVGEADDRDFSSFPATPVTLEAYTLVGLSAQIAVMPASSIMGLMATLRVENLLDEQYRSAYGFPAPGRALWVGVRIER
jgi:vitamin B12 transporter